MREGWEMKRLDHVCNFINGRAYNKEELLDNGKYLVLRVGNFFTNNHWYYSDLELPGDKYCDNGDLLYAWSASFGPRIWTGEKVIYHYHIWKIIPDSKLITKEFLYLLLDWDTDKIKSDQGTGTTMMHVSKGSIEARVVPIPPLPEQQRIVAILDEAFAAIAKAKANAKQNLKNAKELFESYLQGVFEQRGDGWEEKTLSEISIEFARGKSKHRPRGDVSLLGGRYPLIQTGDISNANHWITEYTQTYNDKGLAQSKLWPKGTICIAIVGANVAETAILNFDACFPDSVIGIVVDPKKANNEYVDYLLQTFKTYLKEKGKGTARDNINLGTFENQKFPFPSVKEQQSIVQKLDALSAQTKKLEAIYQQKINDLEELKKVILQKAFSGELKTAEILAV